MSKTPLVKLYPLVETFYGDPNLTTEEVFSEIQPFITWELLDLDPVNDILLAASADDNITLMIILQGQAAQVWLRYHNSGLPR